MIGFAKIKSHVWGTRLRIAQIIRLSGFILTNPDA
jgi:hypothetical protein